MKTIKIILPALAFVFAIAGVFASSNSTAIQGYIKTGNGDFSEGECEADETCDGTVNICENAAGVQLFGLNAQQTFCTVVLREN